MLECCETQTSVGESIEYGWENLLDCVLEKSFRSMKNRVEGLEWEGNMLEMLCLTTMSLSDVRTG
eukprot:m.400606 g.400606  ORF g.400606 m.400606 type:complete len:65 (-) comp21160_c0_seq2:1983-2177(-)